MQSELLDLLLEENFKRHSEEVAQGLHNKKTKSKRAKKVEEQPPLDGLFQPEGTLF